MAGGFDVFKIFVVSTVAAAIGVSGLYASALRGSTVPFEEVAGAPLPAGAELAYSLRDGDARFAQVFLAGANTRVVLYSVPKGSGDAAPDFVRRSQRERGVPDGRLPPGVETFLRAQFNPGRVYDVRPVALDLPGNAAAEGEASRGKDEERFLSVARPGCDRYVAAVALSIGADVRADLVGRFLSHVPVMYAPCGAGN